MSRVDNMGRNVIWQLVATLAAAVLGFLSRFFFMWILGEDYLGLNGLFYSLLGVLTFADLGLNSAFTFCFYKPIARGDTEHIQVLLRVFRKLLRIIMMVIAVAGLALLPFLRVFITGAEYIGDLQLSLYYLVSLANTVLSYWLMYKTCYITARQQAYALVPFSIAGNLATVILQIIAIRATENYMIYLLAGTAVLILQKVVTNLYIRRRYPETNAVSPKPLPQEDKKSIISNVKGILMHKVGEVAVTQTDNIIVSATINIATTGLLSNYIMIKTTVLGMVSMVQSSITAGMGDLAASEDDEVQLNVFYTYMMLNYILMGFVMCGVGVLSTPFITMLFGADKTIDPLTVLLMCVSFYFAYQTYALNVLPTARGRYMVGAYVSLVEAGVNLGVSLVAVQYLGLPGVFLGTFVSALTAYILKPISVFPRIYGCSPARYFKTTLGYFAVSLAIYAVLYMLSVPILGDGVNGVRFITLGLATVLGYFALTCLVWWRNRTFRICVQLIWDFILRLLKRKKA